MDHKDGSSGSKPKGVCEKLFIVIRTTSPFRTLRMSPPQQHRKDAAVAPAPSPNVSLVAPSPALGDRCARVSKQLSVSVPIIFESPTNDLTTNHSNGSYCPRKIDHKVEPIQAKMAVKEKKVTVVPKHGQGNRVTPINQHPKVTYHAETINGRANEYLDRAGGNIRSPTIVRPQKPNNSNLNPDSFNDRVSDFINRTRNRFHAPSSVEEFGSAGAKDRNIGRY